MLDAFVKMFYFMVLICLSVASCQAGTLGAQQVYCGITPNAIHHCLGSPKIVKPEVSSQCASKIEECERTTCIFTKSGWMKGNNLDKTKISDHFDQFAKENPDWQVAVENIKTSCLSTDLPAQGINLNCPSYDVTACAFANLIQHAQPSQWLSSPDCEYPRQYAGACPVCPSDCFATAIPYGSCNACRVLPRKP